MSELTEDLISDILSRLPVKLLLRFRCVSKTWCALIDSKNFTKQHLNHSIVNNTNLNLVFHKDHASLHSVSLNSLNNSRSNLQLIQPPFTSPSYRVTKLIGSCNGLLCLLVYNDSDNFILIWNPSTRKHIKLPVVYFKNPFTIDGSDVDVLYGFGYNFESDDYNVLMVVQFSELEDQDSFQLVANVYSLRSDSWKKSVDFPKYRVTVRQQPCVLACGALNWFITKEGDETVVASYDLGEEEYNVFRLPCYPDNRPVTLYLVEMDSCLSVVCSHFEAGVVDVWVLKDYRRKEWWAILVTFKSEEIKRSVNHVIPLAYSESEDEVLLMQECEKLIWYNVKKKRNTNSIDVCGIHESFRHVICMESFVSVGEKAEDDEKRQGGENEGAKREHEEKFLSEGFKLRL